ncbi:MAG: C39 family peptidase [Vicinamibacteria bacterium]|nr:C39 family peptidase [Vicinamibacteria bacterium]
MIQLPGSEPGIHERGREGLTELVSRARALHVSGRSFQAYEALLAFGRLQDAPGTDGRLIAGRVAGCIGGRRLAEALHFLAWRRDRDHPEARYYFALNIHSRRGPLQTFRFMQANPLGEAPDNVRADWLALRARVLADFRDFEEAERAIAEALQIAPQSDWLMSERADLLRRADRVDEARAWLESAWEKTAPWSRPVLWSLALLRNDLEDAEGALALLNQGLAVVESGALLQFKAAIEADRGLLDEALASLARARALMPLMDRTVKPGFLAQEAQLLLLRRDFDGIRRMAERDPSGFAASLIPRLEKAGSEARRVRLNVRRIRQDYSTCAPASFCALTAFWQRPVDHKALSQQISYDGTPGHRERHWAETHGWRVREFRVTWEAARRLIDRGLPFTLVTTGPENAHEQVVVGYDEAVRAILICDPSSPLVSSYDIDVLTQDQEIVGPRGLVIVPEGREDLLDAVELEDATLYDLRFAIDRALFDNRRDAADAAFAELRNVAPDSIHRLWAQRAIASYDQNEASFAEVATALHARFENSSSAIEARLHALDWAGKTADSLALLEKVAEGPPRNPAFLHTYARALRPDAREAKRVASLVEASLAARPAHPPSLALEADILWERGEREEALSLYRFASTGAEASEENAEIYFRAAHRLGLGETGLSYLRARFERLRGQSSAPFQTLFWQLQELDRGADAFQELEAELDRAKEGDFACWAADIFGRFGRFDRARALLDAHRSKTRPAYWERVSADLHSYQGHASEAAAAWRRIVAMEPLAVDAHRSLASLIAVTSSPAEACAYVEEVSARFPHHVGLAHLRYQWSDISDEKGDAALRALLDLAPGDPWLRRERALFLAQRGRLEEAAIEVARAEELDGITPSFHFVKGEVLGLAGRRDEARASFRRAVAADVSHVAALRGLLQMSQEAADSMEAIRFVIAELKRQPRWSEALFALVPWMVERLSPKDVLLELEEIGKARPDHFETALVIVDQLLSMSRPEAALEVIRVAEGRFQNLPGLALRAADAHAQLGHKEEEWEAVERALRLSPRWAFAVRRYAELLCGAGRVDEGVRRIETAIAQNPFNIALRIQLADLQWQAGKREAALATIEGAVTVDSSSPGAWDRFVEWAHLLNCRGRAIDALRRLCDSRPGSADLWLLVAQTLRRPEDFDERIAALDRVIALNPRATDACDLKATLLASAGEFDLAQRACRPAFWGDEPPHELRGRAAWVLYQSGAREKAIEAMLKVLKDVPGYRWGLDILLLWLGDTPGHARYPEVAERFTDLAPLDAVAWGHRAAAALARQQREAACGFLRRAIELDSSYTYGVRNLADTLFREGRKDEALRVLADSPQAATDESLLRLRLHLALEMKDDVAAKEAIETWLQLPEVDDSLLQEAIQECERAGRRSLVQDAFVSAGARIKSWRTGAAWVAEALSVGSFSVARKRLNVLRPFSAAHVGGIYQVLVDQGNRVGLSFAWFRRSHRLEIASAPLLWGALGNCLLRRRSFGAVRRAMADWRERVKRGEAQPWMLTNMMEALLALGRTDEACDVARAALSLQRDHATERFEAALAAYQAFDGPLGEVNALLQSAARASQGKPKAAFRFETARAIAEFRQLGDRAVHRNLPRPPAGEADAQSLHLRAQWRLRAPGVAGAVGALFRIIRVTDPVALLVYEVRCRIARSRYRPRS